VKLLAICALLLTAALSHPALAQQTLYQRLGGQPGVTQIVHEAVDLYLADDRIKADFDNINLDRLRSRLTDQICQLANGPCVYHGRSMKASHAGLELNQAKFNAVAEDLQTAMEHVGIPYWTQNQLMALLAPMQRDIVTR
jgi:hemoglobin